MAVHAFIRHVLTIAIRYTVAFLRPKLPVSS